MVGALVAGCAGKKGAAPEAEPAAAQALADTLVRNSPSVGQARECQAHELIGGSTMTHATITELAGRPGSSEPEGTEWANPPELDSPAARQLLDDATDLPTKRRAAAELLSAPFHLVYRIDLVNVPMALGIKELKRGVVNARAIRYDRAGKVECVLVFVYQNDEARSNWAMDRSDGAQMDPEVSRILREDLKEQLLKTVVTLGDPNAPKVKHEMTPKPREP